jgi:hypothetical protein
MCLEPREAALEDCVALVEVNHFHDESGKHVFDQLIFYDWCRRLCRHQVVAWRLIKSPAQAPRRDWRRGDYCCSWSDSGVLRNVRATNLRETWTQYDPELIERGILPLSQRRELAAPREQR